MESGWRRWKKSSSEVMIDTGELTSMVEMIAKLWGGEKKGLTKALTAYAVCSQGYNWYKFVKAKMGTGANSYTVSVNGIDALYPYIQEWFLDQLPETDQRFLRVGCNAASYDPYASRSNTVLQIYYDAELAHDLTINGHSVNVRIDSPDFKDSPAQSAPGPRRDVRTLEKMIFTATDVEGQQAVLDLLNDIYENSIKGEQKAARLFTYTKYGWDSASEFQKRPIESVILRSGQKERIMADIERFLLPESEAKYASLGIPYHRGYMLSGEPGTGKTSLVKALASHFGLNVYYVSLPSVDSDSSLTEALSGVAPRSILLLEDIDIAHASRDRDDDSPGVTMSGLLNILDGFLTPHGLITFLTTNRVEELDPALIRPGRVDLAEELPGLDQDQLERMLTVFLGHSVNVPTMNSSLSPASIIEVLKRHIDAPDQGVPEILDLVTTV